MNIKKYHLIALLTAISGFLHLLIVSTMHRENFIELWFFAVFGLIQVYFAFQLYLKHKNPSYYIYGIIINGLFLTLWLMTRIFNAPFANYSESITSFDTIIAVFELLAIYLSTSLCIKKGVSIQKMSFILVLTLLLGIGNYAGAKMSEKIFKSIPISKMSHKHSIMNIFKEPIIKSKTEMIMLMGQEMTQQEAVDHCKIKGMAETKECLAIRGEKKSEKKNIDVPKAHDNSDGHHNI